MLFFSRKNISLFFWVIACMDIIAGGWNIPWLNIAAKPLLMPLLLCNVIINGRASAARKFIITGLFLSFAGDILLLGDERQPLFFICGLVCFLVTHICYCLYFFKIKMLKPEISVLKQRPYLVFTVLIYITAFLVVLYPKLGDLRIPVIIYSCVLSCMLLCSLHAYNSVSIFPARIFIAGAVLFVLSDSLLAVNKFHTPLPYAAALIMLSYCFAQYFIVEGVIKNRV